MGSSIRPSKVQSWDNDSSKLSKPKYQIVMYPMNILHQTVVFMAIPSTTPIRPRLCQPHQRHALGKGYVKAAACGTGPAVHELIEGFFPQEPGTEQSAPKMMMKKLISQVFDESKPNKFPVKILFQNFSN